MNLFSIHIGAARLGLKFERDFKFRGPFWALETITLKRKRRVQSSPASRYPEITIKKF
ncbi:hypothetical protein [Desulfobotulus mexicanus]|uniref:hypothetical protein n=1 Tax=Desulfobotulus mexicanus TaxID=2586642 RepID=UPI0015D24861|nr:hypothetical protein [Desulfobotulus mexicanus]